MIQIVNGEQNEQSNNYKDTETIEVKGTRGNIYDRKGKLLAYNELSYSVTIEDTGELKTKDEKNAMIYKLIQIIEKNGGSITNNFGIKMDEYGNLEFSVSDSSLTRFKRDVYSLRTSETLSEEQENATAEQVFQYLRYGNDTTSMFNISDKYSREDALKIMSVRYAIYMNRYQQYLKVTVATGVDDVTVAAIKENSRDLPGVEIVADTTRVYNDSVYFAHILGYTGIASDTELEELGETYNTTDQVGKSGIEKLYESQLVGTKGYQKVTVNDTGKILEVLDTKDPSTGNDVYLTIDSDLQKASYDLLEKKLADILVSKIVNSTSTGSKGTSSDNITIPIYDVYFALIDNNIIDISHFNEEDATDLEKSVYKKFLSQQSSVLKKLESLLAVDSKTVNSKASDEMEEFLEYVYTTLTKSKILLESSIDKESDYYVNYTKNKISLSEFLQYAISNNWVDLTKLDIGDEYYSTEEIYEKLIEYTLDNLKDNSTFNKKVYHSLVYSYKLSGTEICLLLYDQDVLKYDKKEIKALKSNGANYAYNFMIKKIKNIEITPAQLALEPCSGSVVITDVESGDVLALVSYPSYDNNKLANTVDTAYYNQLYNDKSSPMLNRPTQTQTAPGSTFKLVSSIAGLEEQVITPAEKIKDLGVFTKITPSPKCWAYPSHTHGSIDVSDAIRDSCNYFFYELGYRLSIDSNGKYNSDLGLKKLAKYATMFGLNDKSGVEVSEYSPQISSESSVRSAIGQGNNNFAPVQISRYVTGVANSGTVYNLTLIDKITDSKGETIEDNSASVYNEVDVKQSTWDSVHEGMYKVVNAATSSLKNIFDKVNVKVAGKTGTAQQSKSSPNHALFVSYAPYDNPEISVTTVIPNGYTSSNAAGLASEIYRYYFNKEDINDLLSGESSTTGTNSTGVTD